MIKKQITLEEFIKLFDKQIHELHKRAKRLNYQSIWLPKYHWTLSNIHHWLFIKKIFNTSIIWPIHINQFKYYELICSSMQSPRQFNTKEEAFKYAYNLYMNNK